MVGEILINGVAAFRMEDNGTYTALDERFKPAADWLNDTHNPTNDSEAGDSARPFGIAALARAANIFDGGTVRLSKPVSDIPEGAVN